jgi:chromosome segregation ATPase
MSDEARLERIENLCRSLVNWTVEADAKLKFIQAQVDVNADDGAGLARIVKQMSLDVANLQGKSDELKKAVEQLTSIANGHAARISQHDKTIHELQADERRATAGTSERPR